MGVYRLRSLRVFLLAGSLEAKPDCVRYRSAATASASVLKADTRGEGTTNAAERLNLGQSCRACPSGGHGDHALSRSCRNQDPVRLPAGHVAALIRRHV